MNIYNGLSQYLKNRYGTRVQRIPLSAGFGCPNRDGTKGRGGCIFCDESGSGFAACSPDIAIEIQFEKMASRAKEKYGEDIKFFSYFQSYSNTYADIKTLQDIFSRALTNPSVVGLDVSTRPDLLNEETLDLLASFKKRADVFVEMGLQSTNPLTLKILRRGHTLAEFVDSVIRLKKRGIEVIAHIISDLPWDSRIDTVESAKILSALEVEGVKCHSLYTVKGSDLEKVFSVGKVRPLSIDEFEKRIILFLEHLSPDTVIHRLVSDPPSFAEGNWKKKKIEIINSIEKRMEAEKTWQGRKFNYLNR